MTTTSEKPYRLPADIINGIRDMVRDRYERGEDITDLVEPFITKLDIVERVRVMHLVLPGSLPDCHCTACNKHRLNPNGDTGPERVRQQLLSAGLSEPGSEECWKTPFGLAVTKLLEQKIQITAKRVVREYPERPAKKSRRVPEMVILQGLLLQSYHGIPMDKKDIIKSLAWLEKEIKHETKH